LAKGQGSQLALNRLKPKAKCGREFFAELRQSGADGGDERFDNVDRANTLPREPFELLGTGQGQAAR